MVSHKGLFITFEGPEGGGKTTQIHQLSQFIQQQGREVVVTREPGGTSIGISIRNILLDPTFEQIDRRTELLLFLADRAQHVHEVIMPGLESGKVVLCDRFIDSTVAYQVAGRGFDPSLIATLNDFSAHQLKPILTFLLDVDYTTGIRRATRVYQDRFELEKQNFHERIREQYLRIHAAEPNRMVKIETGVDSIDVIQSRIRDALIRSKLLS